MALPTFVAAGTYVSTTTGTLTPGLPSGWAIDDILIISHFHRGSSPPGAPTGYAEIISGGEVMSGSSGRLNVYWKRAVSGETAQVIGANGNACAQMVAYRGCKTTGNPFEAEVGGVKNTASTSFTSTGLTTLGADRLYWCSVGRSGDDTNPQFSSWASTNASNVLERIDDGFSAGTGGGTAGAEGGAATTGSYGPFTATIGISVANAWIEFALIPTANTISGSFTADAVLFKNQTGSFSANAVLKKTGLAGSFTADAYINAPFLGSFTANSVLLTPQASSLTANSVLFKTQTGSFIADSVLFKTQTGDLAANSVLFKTQTGSLVTDAFFLKVQSGSFTADAVLFRTQPGSFSADAIRMPTFSADSTLMRVQSGSINSNATLMPTMRVDGVILRTRDGSFTANAWVAGIGSSAFDADAIMFRVQTGSLTADEISLRTQTGSLTADEISLKTQSGSLTADEISLRVQTGSLTADEISLKQQSASSTADADLLRTQSGSLTADALSQKTPLGGLSSDSTLRATIAGGLTADAAFLGAVLSFTADAEFVGDFFIADALIVSATRFYLNSASAPNVSPSMSASWESTGSAQRRIMSYPTRASSTKANLGVAEVSASSSFDVLVYQFVSDPIPVDVTICGPLGGIIRVLESSSAADDRSQMIVKVVSNDGFDLVGTVLDTDEGSLSAEWPTTGGTFASVKFPQTYSGLGAATTPVDASAGDRIVVEVGYRAHNTSTTSRTGSVRAGHSVGGADFTTTGQTTDLNPWIDIRATDRLRATGGFTLDAWFRGTITKSFVANAVVAPTRVAHNRYNSHRGVDYADSQFIASVFGNYYPRQSMHSVLGELDARITAREGHYRHTIQRFMADAVIV